MPAGDTLVAGTINANSGSSSAPAAGSVVSIASLAEGTVALQLTGTWVGTVIMEGIEAGGDPTAWLAAPTTTLAGVPATNLTANGIYLVNAAPFVIVRVRATAWTSGAATVTLHGALATTGGGGGGGGGGAVTVADGADTAEGATTDAAVQGDNAGTISAKLRGLNKSVAAGLPVTQQGTWNVTVNAALPTGANVIGAVTQSGTWNVTVNTALPTGANTIGIVNQGTANTAANAWPTKLTDGTNTAAVKAASTAAVAADPAAVIALSPNSPLPTGTNTAGNVGGISAPVNATLTRPANTTTYTANTAVANATSSAAQITFSNAGTRSGGSGFIIGASILDEANQTLKGQFELWVFDTTLGTIINDNANWAPANADLSNLVGVIKFDSGTVGNNAAGASGNVIFTDTLSKPLPYKCSGSANLFAQLVVRNAYVPINAEVFVLRLDLSQDA